MNVLFCDLVQHVVRNRTVADAILRVMDTHNPHIALVVCEHGGEGMTLQVEVGLLLEHVTGKTRVGMKDVQHCLHEAPQHRRRDQSAIHTPRLAEHAVISNLASSNCHHDHVQRGKGSALVELEGHIVLDAVIHGEHLRLL